MRIEPDAEEGLGDLCPGPLSSFEAEDLCPPPWRVRVRDEAATGISGAPPFEMLCPDVGRRYAVTVDLDHPLPDGTPVLWVRQPPQFTGLSLVGRQFVTNW